MRKSMVPRKTHANPEYQLVITIIVFISLSLYCTYVLRFGPRPARSGATLHQLFTRSDFKIHRQNVERQNVERQNVERQNVERDKTSKNKTSNGTKRRKLHFFRGSLRPQFLSYLYEIFTECRPYRCLQSVKILD